MDEIEVLKSVTSKLEDGRVPYMLTGSVAFNYYSIPKLPLDIDFVIDINLSRFDELLNLFSSAFYFNKGRDEKSLEKDGRIDLIHKNSILKVDFLLKKNTAFGKTEMERKRSVPFEGLNLYFVSPEDLILSATVWIGEKNSTGNAGEIQTLYSTVPNLDLGYMEAWAEKLKVSELNKKAEKGINASPKDDPSFREMIMKKSGQERLMIGFSMSNLARKQALSSIMEKNKDLNIQEIRKELFLRTYGQDFPPEKV